MHVKWFLSQWIRVSELASIFPDSLYIWNIYALTYDICFSLSDFTLSDRLYVHLGLQIDIESGLEDTGQEREEGTNWDSSLDIYILPCARSEKAMAPTPVLLPGKSHGQRSLVGCSPRGHKEWDTTERLHFHFSLSCTGEGNGNPLQCSCLENPRDGGAWWAIYGVAQSRTRLKRLSSSSMCKIAS